MVLKLPALLLGGCVIILLFGPPGCGKGTQAEFISSRFGIPAISTGEVFRAECKAGTELGKMACSIFSKGGLVGDDIVNPIIARRISRPDCASGFLLDGYPRTLPQAKFLDRILHQGVMSIHLDVPFSMIVERITARRQCPKCSHIYNLLFQPPKTKDTCDFDGATLTTREDDREEVIWQRLKAYEEMTGPVIAHYSKSSYYRLDGTASPAEVSAQIERVLETCTVPTV
jgi:adenylate kinase